MRKGGSKQKGAANERLVCRQLSLWVTNGKREDIFWRSAMSGGRATVAKRKGVHLAAQSGDISSIDKQGHPLTEDFYIETKHVRDIALDRFILTGTGPLMRYWQTACREARSYRKRPLLIIKQNLLPMILLCRRGTVQALTGGKLKVNKSAAIVHQSGCEIWLFDTVLAVPFNYQPVAVSSML